MTWNDQAIKQLRYLVSLNLTDIELAKFFSTTVGAIENARRRNGIKRVPASKNVFEDDLDYDALKRKYGVEWHISKSTRAPKRKTFKTYLAVADTHVPYGSTPAIKSVLKLMDDVPFDGFLIVGDYMDMAPISHWLRDKKKNRSLEKKRMSEDYVSGNVLLDEFDKRLPEKCDKRFFYGNHERFYYDLTEEIPALEGLFDPKQELHLQERKYVVYDDINHIERIGRLSVTHGMYHTMNYVKKHIEAFKTNVLFAHLHSPRMRLDISPAKEIAICGYCIGCLSDLNPSYLQNRPRSWAHGFAVIYFYDKGYFDVDIKRIVKGKFVFGGKLYDGNK